jgi:hypothetical protein
MVALAVLLVGEGRLGSVCRETVGWANGGKKAVWSWFVRFVLTSLSLLSVSSAATTHAPTNSSSSFSN